MTVSARAPRWGRFFVRNQDGKGRQADQRGAKTTPQIRRIGYKGKAKVRKHLGLLYQPPSRGGRDIASLYMFVLRFSSSLCRPSKDIPMATDYEQEHLAALDRIAKLLEGIQDDIRWLRNREANKEAYLRNASSEEGA
jgi:hypothetical protein